MRILLQRVKRASVSVKRKTIGKINHGLLLYVGITHDDSKKSVDWMVNKVIGLRIFPDEKGKMNFDVLQIGASALVVSQFTLYGNCLRGKRPDFIEAAPLDLAEELYDYFVMQLKKFLPTQTGSFGAHMEVKSINDGPVTLLIAK